LLQGSLLLLPPVSARHGKEHGMVQGCMDNMIFLLVNHEKNRKIVWCFIKLMLPLWRN